MNDEFTKSVRQDLRRMVETTPLEVRARLDRMVDDAVQGRARARPPARRFGWPVGAMAATLAAVTMGLFMVGRPYAPSPTTTPASPADDVALLLNVDNLDLLEQMEFYLWLDRQPGLLEGDGAAAPVSQPS